MNQSSFFTILVIAFAILIPLGGLKYRLRHRFAQELLQGDAQKRLAIQKTSGLTVRWLRWFIYISPVLMVAIPYVLYKDLEVKLPVAIAGTVLMLGNIFLEYLFRKWLYNRLQSNNPDLSS